MIETAYYKYHGQRIEHILIKNADAIFTNSLFLEKYAQTINNVCFFTGQGCDTHLYDPESITSVPEDIIQIPYPIIGYTGALRTLRLDIPLLETIASKRPNWSFVFIGTEDESFSKSALHFMPNVHFLGSRDAHLLPTYVSSFDVAINPQIVNKTTLGNYPRKIDEYLSMGKPVVATRTEAMEMFSDYVFLADNCETFIQGIDYALQHNTPAQIQARKEYAQTHTWEKVVKTMIQIIQNNFKIY
jgi:glycosyltransferase involved in cell wall biosynthesis